MRSLRKTVRMKRRMLASLEDDIHDHIERETRDNIERGMPPEEARHAALRKFGNITRVKEETRDVWSRVWLEQLFQDVRYGLRMLLRNPGFAAVVILTLALGIGMNTAVFSVVNAVLLRPLACPHPDRLVWIGGYDPNIKRDVADSPDFAYWREHAQSYSGMAAYGPQQAAMVTLKDAEQVSGVVIAGDFWTLTGARPALGRLFGPREQDAVVLAWDLFEHQFASDPHVVGRSVAVDGRPVTVTGVLPKDFRFQFPMWWQSVEPRPVEAYFPLPAQDMAMGRIVSVVASLTPGIRAERALAELNVLEKRAQEGRNPQFIEPTAGMRVEALTYKLTGAARPALLVLLAAGVFVLLIAVLNIASVLLARATVRQREIAIRAAVGAGRARVIRQLLVESLVLALIGGAAGLALARSALAILIRLSPNAAPRLQGNQHRRGSPCIHAGRIDRHRHSVWFRSCPRIMAHQSARRPQARRAYLGGSRRIAPSRIAGSRRTGSGDHAAHRRRADAEELLAHACAPAWLRAREYPDDEGPAGGTTVPRGIRAGTLHARVAAAPGIGSRSRDGGNLDLVPFRRRAISQRYFAEPAAHHSPERRVDRLLEGARHTPVERAMARQYGFRRSRRAVKREHGAPVLRRSGSARPPDCHSRASHGSGHRLRFEIFATRRRSAGRDLPII
jgi:hypothetical protein